MSNEKSTIGDNIKKYRNKLGISQDQLSKKADLAFHTIAKIEAVSTPNPTIDTVKKIADALGVFALRASRRWLVLLVIHPRRRRAAQADRPRQVALDRDRERQDQELSGGGAEHLERRSARRRRRAGALRGVLARQSGR